MELRRYFQIIRRRILLVALTIIAALAAAYAGSNRTSVYAAESTLYVGSRQLDTLGGVSADQQVGLQRVIKTFATMIDSQPIAEAALPIAGVPRSAAGVVAATIAAPVPDTQLLRIRVSDIDPAVARDLANAIADAFVEKIASFEPSTEPEPGSLPQLPAYVFQRAGLPTAPQPGDLTRRLVLGGLFGAVAALGVVFLLEYLDVTIKSTSDAEHQLELPVLGVIPYERAAPPTSDADDSPQYIAS